MNSHANFLKACINRDFPTPPPISDLNLNFCSEKLLTSSHQATILNLLQSYLGSERFLVKIYALFNDGCIGKYEYCRTLCASEIPKATFSVLFEEIGEKALDSFGICLINPNDSKLFMRMFVNRRV